MTFEWSEKANQQKNNEKILSTTRKCSGNTLLYSGSMLFLGCCCILWNVSIWIAWTKTKPQSLTASCVEIVAYDRDEMEELTKKSINYPPTPCDTLRLKRHAPGKTWRKATWSKADVISQYASNISQYDYVMVRDIDTKVNTSHVLGMLQRDKTNKTFAIGFRREGQKAEAETARCDEVVPVTNWFAYDPHHDKLHKKWSKIKIKDRYDSDQAVLNARFQPCCRDDVLCIDKCMQEVGEVHCRRKQSVNNKRHYGRQLDCILNQTERNVGFYHPAGTYSCKGTIKLTFD